MLARPEGSNINFIRRSVSQIHIRFIQHVNEKYSKSGIILYSRVPCTWKRKRIKYIITFSLDHASLASSRTPGFVSAHLHLIQLSPISLQVCKCEYKLSWDKVTCAHETLLSRIEIEYQEEGEEEEEEGEEACRGDKCSSLTQANQMCMTFCHLSRLHLSSHKLEPLVSWLIEVRVQHCTWKGRRESV